MPNNIKSQKELIQKQRRNKSIEKNIDFMISKFNVRKNQILKNDELKEYIDFLRQSGQLEDLLDLLLNNLQENDRKQFSRQDLLQHIKNNSLKIYQNQFKEEFTLKQKLYQLLQVQKNTLTISGFQISKPLQNSQTFQSKYQNLQHFSSQSQNTFLKNQQTKSKIKPNIIKLTQHNQKLPTLPTFKYKDKIEKVYRKIYAHHGDQISYNQTINFLKAVFPENVDDMFLIFAKNVDYNDKATFDKEQLILFFGSYQLVQGNIQSSKPIGNQKLQNQLKKGHKKQERKDSNKKQERKDSNKKKSSSKNKVPKITFTYQNPIELIVQTKVLNQKKKTKFPQNQLIKQICYKSLFDNATQFFEKYDLEKSGFIHCNKIQNHLRKFFPQKYKKHSFNKFMETSLNKNSLIDKNDLIRFLYVYKIENKVEPNKTSQIDKKDQMQ